MIFQEEQEQTPALHIKKPSWQEDTPVRVVQASCSPASIKAQKTIEELLPISTNILMFPQSLEARGLPKEEVQNKLRAAIADCVEKLADMISRLKIELGRLIVECEKYSIELHLQVGYESMRDWMINGLHLSPSLYHESRLLYELFYFLHPYGVALEEMKNITKEQIKRLLRMKHLVERQTMEIAEKEVARYLQEQHQQEEDDLRGKPFEDLMQLVPHQEREAVRQQAERVCQHHIAAEAHTILGMSEEDLRMDAAEDGQVVRVTIVHEVRYDPHTRYLHLVSSTPILPHACLSMQKRQTIHLYKIISPRPKTMTNDLMTEQELGVLLEALGVDDDEYDEPY